MTKDKKERIQYLLLQYMEGRTSERETDELFLVLEEEKDDAGLNELLEELLATEADAEDFKAEEWRGVISQIVRGSQRKGIVKRLTSRFKWVAAASVLVALAAGYFLWYNQLQKQDTAGIHQTKQPQNDIEPGREGAVLTLANGKQIVLDSALDGAIARQGNAEVVKQGGVVAYNVQKGNNNAEITYNTLVTPPGRTYSLMLADGSRVWLNAASSIRFPSAFPGDERMVEITGEAYFEVAKDARRPFKVVTIAARGGEVQGAEIEVLGTHFNINNYGDELAMKTTLLEGRVRVSTYSRSDQKILAPGEQAIIEKDNEAITINRAVDVEQVMAWKNGYFSFKNADLETILRQAARWYDVEVQFKARPAVQFSGKIGRGLTLKEFLDILDETRVHYTIEGRKLTIIP